MSAPLLLENTNLSCILMITHSIYWTQVGFKSSRHNIDVHHKRTHQWLLAVLPLLSTNQFICSIVGAFYFNSKLVIIGPFMATRLPYPLITYWNTIHIEVKLRHLLGSEGFILPFLLQPEQTLKFRLGTKHPEFTNLAIYHSVYKAKTDH